MRGSIAYVLALLILLNIGGYHALFLAMQLSSTENLTKKLDDNSYNPEESFLVKVPLTLPYAINSHNYERVDGKFEYEGKIYRLVKQKMSNDTLHVVLLEDRVGNYINKAKTDFAKTLTDQPVNDAKSSSSKIFKQLSKDYLSHQVYLQTANKGSFTENSSKQYFNFYSFRISDFLFNPPEFIVAA